MIKIKRPKCPKPDALSGEKQKKDYKNKINKEALKKASHEKCAYCEDKFLSSSFARIDHIKPISDFKEMKYDWHNLAFSCERCNSIKSNKYDKDCPIINPYDEDPEEHIMAFGGKIDPKNNSKKGQRTISREYGLDLNRTELLENRRERMRLIENGIELAKRCGTNELRAVITTLENEALPDKKYSLCIMSYLEAEKLDLEGK